MLAILFFGIVSHALAAPFDQKGKQADRLDHREANDVDYNSDFELVDMPEKHSEEGAYKGLNLSDALFDNFYAAEVKASGAKAVNHAPAAHLSANTNAGKRAMSSERSTAMTAHLNQKSAPNRPIFDQFLETIKEEPVTEAFKVFASPLPAWKK